MFEKAEERFAARPVIPIVQRVPQDGLEKHGLYTAEQRREKKHRRNMRILAGIALTTETLYFGGVETPIFINEQFFLKHSEASITEVFPAANEEANDSIILVVGGYGTRRSRPIAEALQPLNQLGSVHAIEEDHTGIDVENIAANLITQAEQAGKTKVILWGDSIGGAVLAQVAKIIQTSDSPISVSMLVLDGTPSSFNALRPDQQNNLRLLETLNKLVPNIADHPLTQFVIKASQEKENILKFASSVRGSAVAGEMIEDARNGTTVPAALQSSQINFIVNGNDILKNSFTALGRVTTKQPPFVVLIFPANSSNDAVENPRVSEPELTAMLADTNLPYMVVHPNLVSHADPTITNNGIAYRSAITEEIIPAIKANDERYLSRFISHATHVLPRQPQ